MLDNILDRTVIATALKGAFALTLAASVALYFHYTLFWWALFVCLISIQPDIGTSVMTLSLRFLGAYIGATIAVTIALLTQFPWVYYPLIMVFVFGCLYYIIQPNVPFAGIICFFTALSCLLAGPMYAGGVVHYAIERCLQITFALMIVIFTLFILRTQHAYEILTSRIGDVLGKYEKLWTEIMQGFLQEQRRPIESLVREISIELGKLYPLLQATHYERKKNFDAGQCLYLLQLLKRLLSVFTALNEISRYAKHENFSPHTQKFMQQLNLEIIQALKQLRTMLETGAIQYQSSTEELEKEFRRLMDERLAAFIQQVQTASEFDLNRVAWFSTVQRLFYIFSLTRKTIVLMNSNKSDAKLSAQLAKEMQWIKGEDIKESRFNPIRFRLALHGAIAGALILIFQQYYLWSPMYTMFGLLTIQYISLSYFNPSSSNIGLSFLGGLCGFIYVYLASWVLNYNQHYLMVLALLFLGAFIAAYFLLLSKLRGRAFLGFSIFFGICVIYMLTAEPSQRNNFNFAVILLAGILSGVLVYAAVRKIILPIDYKKLMRTGLTSILIHQALIIRYLTMKIRSEEEVQEFQTLLYQQSQRINKVRSYVQHCIDMEMYDKTSIERLHEVTYSCELMLLSNISMLRPYFSSHDYAFIQELFYHSQKENRIVVRNLINYAHNFCRNTWSKPVLQDVDQLKQSMEHEIKKLIPKILETPDYIQELRNISVVYNALHRMFDVQIRLLSIKNFKF